MYGNFKKQSDQEFEVPTYNQTPVSLAHLGLVRPLLATDTEIYVLKV